MDPPSEDLPLVSVVVPTYDRPAKLVTAVRSVAAQTYPNIELVVVDDASPSPAREVLEGGSFGGLRWRCIRHDRNQGANTARNTGIREASGDIVAFLDDDDSWLPEYVDAQVAQFREGEDVGVALVGQRYTYGGKTTTVRIPTVGGDATRGLLEGEVSGTFSTMAVRRWVLERAGLPDEELPAWQDLDWQFRLSRHCSFAVDPRPLVVKGAGEYEQIENAFEEKRDVSYPRLIEKHRDLAAEYDREREFVESLSIMLASSGLTNGHSADARRFAFKALRLNPLLFRAWVLLLLALVPSWLYQAIIATRRRVIQLRN